MRIKLTSIMVDDQSKALKFYTDILGFIPRKSIPVSARRVADFSIGGSSNVRIDVKNFEKFLQLGSGMRVLD